MKSFRSIVLEENEEMAADIPATVNDTELKTGDPLNAVDGNGEMPLTVGEEEGIDNAADSVAADIVDGEDVPEQGEQSVDADADASPEDAPVASVDAEDGEPVASVDAPHAEPDGDEGPNPTAPSDNDGDEETDVVATTAAQTTESLVIIQCGLVATEAAMRLTEAASTEAFLGARDNASKKIVVEGFTDKIKGVWEKLKAFLIKIKNAIVNFAQKIVTYVKSLFARVYAKMAKSLYAKKAQANWAKGCDKVEITVPPMIAKDGINTLGKVPVKNVVKQLDTIVKTKKVANAKAWAKSYAKESKNYVNSYIKLNEGKPKTIKVSNIFGSYGGASAFIAKGYEKTVDNVNEGRDKVTKACDEAIKSIKDDKDSKLASAKVGAINAISNNYTEYARYNVRLAIKSLQLAATSIKRVAGYKAAKESYIDSDLMAFFHA